LKTEYISSQLQGNRYIPVFVVSKNVSATRLFGVIWRKPQNSVALKNIR
jgi:hypothetical protein